MHASIEDDKSLNYVLYGKMIFPPHALLLTCIFIWLSETIAGTQNYKKHQLETECGSRPTGRAVNIGPQRTPKIISGTQTLEGQFPWQASLELLHPSMGFLGHWCGGVLIHQYWVLSAAHCVHNDLFNLPIPPLWTVVLGEYDRSIESGSEQRIPVEKIVLHKNYENFLHDLVLMKLSMPANLNRKSSIRRICLPFAFDEQAAMGIVEKETYDIDDPLEIGLSEVPEKADNFLRSMGRRRNLTLPSMHDLMRTKIMKRVQQAQQHQQLQQAQQQRSSRAIRTSRPIRRRNDKFMRIHSKAEAAEYSGLLEQYNDKDSTNHKELPFMDCIATGWGKTNVTGDLSNLLLKTRVPLHNNKRCKDAYGGFVKIHRGHLCAGKLNGKGGTCVGDSGGPLQCRLTKNGPWILAGITSFGSGCAIAGFPDVYTRTSFYLKWIQDTIAFE